jgi:hypothetical protein
MTFITCQARRGDTVISAVLDTSRTVRSISRNWVVPDGPADFQRIRDSLSQTLGAGVPCETDVDVSFDAGRAWTSEPLVVELRLGGPIGRGRIELTKRVSTVNGG